MAAKSAKSFWYAKPKTQAARMIRGGLALGKARHNSRNDGKIHSRGTARAYQSGLTLFCDWIQRHKLGDLPGATVKIAERYLTERAGKVGQKTLDRDRQSIQFLLRQTSGMDIKLPRLKTSFRGGRRLAEQSRAVTVEQLNAICRNLSPRSALAARICYWSGLRAHELHTLEPRYSSAPSKHRKWSRERFKGRNGQLYVVKGKGGLKREVMLPFELAAELERLRLPKPAIKIDRGIRYSCRYDLTAGNDFSCVFTAASKKALGWSTGAHGLRHSYAQDRMIELRSSGCGRRQRMEIVSQELGHFRADIVEAYLR